MFFIAILLGLIRPWPAISCKFLPGDSMALPQQAFIPKQDVLDRVAKF